MANNTTLNTGTGGDTLRTDDVGGSVKIPVSKIHTGAAGVDGGAVTTSNPFPATLISGSQTGLLVGANPVASTNPLPVQHTSGSQTGILIGANPVSSSNRFPVILSSGSQTGIMIGANPVASTNPLPVSQTSGSQTGILIGANPVASTNPLPITSVSGSQIGILVGANPVATTNPFPVALAAEAASQILSGSTYRTVYHAFGEPTVSGSANQIVPPAGAGNRIAVLSAQLMTPTAVFVRFQSTGSAGVITNISGRMPCPANGGFVLPHNPHAWFKTAANEGLNLEISAAVGCGILITWAIFNNP